MLSPESELVSSDLILVSEKDFRKLFGISKEYATDLTVKIRNQREVNTITRKIKEIYPDTRIITKNEILRTYDAVFNWRGGIMLVIMSGAVMAFIVFAGDKASGLSAEEKREIGILKAIGWETSEIAALPSIPMKIAFYFGMVFTFVSGIYFYLKNRGGYIFSLASFITFIISVLSLISFISLYFYELPTHHCPFCILQREYGYIGYLLYITLLGGSVLGMGGRFVDAI